MPERTIQEVRMYEGRRYRHPGRHYIRITYETWETFDLAKFGTTVHCEVNALLNKNGEPIFIGSEAGECKPYKWIGSSKIGRSVHYDLILSTKLVRRIGIRQGLFVDMLLTRVSRLSKFEEIFPRRLVHGLVETKPKNATPQSVLGFAANLIEHKFEDSFFADLLIEINRAYAYRLYASTLVLLRKLVENLIIELLRAKFGMQSVDLFYWKDKGRHHDLSKLLENLKDSLKELKPISPSFDQNMIDFLGKFKENASAAAHSIDINPNWDYLESLKRELNYYCDLFASAINRMKGGTL